MIDFLIKRPIAVIMSFIAICILGSIAAFDIPVSLMPDIEIPEITVQVSHPNTSVREMEATIIKPLRRQLLQINNIEDITSEARESAGTIHLKFEYGTDNTISFIEVNEKIDMVMRDLPNEVERPRVIKANASDIPVFYINITPVNTIGDETIRGVSELCEAVIKKRIEQLPEVAMADVTGLVYSELYITPKTNILESAGITQEQLQDVLKQNNISYGNILVREGSYHYNVRFSSSLKTVEDIANLYIKANDKILQLKKLATIGIRQQQASGMYLSNNSRGINIAIIKQTEARIVDLKEKITVLVEDLAKEYPEINIDFSQDQTSILDFTIANLKQSLVLGALLAFLMMFFFLKDIKSPILIGFSIPTSLIISLLFFYLMGLSINIISLSGLILGIGMMIDNSIIVIDNIVQYLERGETVLKACIKGTTEVIRPLISSVLTTCAVFLPLIFLSGISGALFYDQAIAVSIGLVVSLLVSITLLPVLFKLFHNKSVNNNEVRKNSFLKKITLFDSENIYQKGFDLVFRQRKFMMPIFILLMGISIVLFKQIAKEKLPKLEQTELMLAIDWNTNLTIEENQKRTSELVQFINKNVVASNSYIGEQQFLLNKEKSLGLNQAQIYIKANSASDLIIVSKNINTFFTQKYQKAIVQFKPYETIFDKLFSDDQPDIVAKISSNTDEKIPTPTEIAEIKNTVANIKTITKIQDIPVENHIVVNLDAEKLMLYDVASKTVFNKLKSAFNVLQIDVLKSTQQYIPIVISDPAKTITTNLKTLTIKNKNNIAIPVSALITTSSENDYKVLAADKAGLHIPLALTVDPEKNYDKNELISNLEHSFKKNEAIDVRFEGKIFSGDKVLKELLFVLFISTLFLYFILAAQFESLTQPLIVLLEIPIDIAGTLLLLYVFGESLNLMSMIGIIVMSGIIINDSILKIATINQLRAEGNDLMTSLHLAGKKRLKPILMTSLTTILALVPFLFYTDLGSELQKPFALAVIGGMVLGTVVSLYFIPLCYYYLYRKKSNSQ